MRGQQSGPFPATFLGPHEYPSRSLCRALFHQPASFTVFLAIFGTFEQDLLFVLIALVLFGKRLPEVANTMGRKMYQFRKGLDEMKSEIAKPIREQLEAPIREATEIARQAARDAERDVRLAAERAKKDVDDSVSKAHAALGPGDAGASSAAVKGGAPARNPFPYPGAPSEFPTLPSPATPEAPADVDGGVDSPAESGPADGGSSNG
jgi:Sec-independent protein translocase protein TatA